MAIVYTWLKSSVSPFFNIAGLSTTGLKELQETTGFLIVRKFRDRFTVLPGPFHRGKLKMPGRKRDRFTVEKCSDFHVPVESFRNRDRFTVPGR